MFPLKLLLIFVFLHLNPSLGASYHCITENYARGKACILSELHLTKDDYVIEPISEYSDAVITIDLEGTVPVLSPHICETFPRLESWVSKNVSLEEIPSNTFNRCSNLKYLDLQHNPITKLHQNSFKGLVKLEKFWMSDGNVQVFDVNLSDLQELYKLSLVDMNIESFVPQSVKGLKKLGELDLRRNNLEDFDVEGILKELTNLQWISLDHNKFKCDRIKEIIRELKAKRVTYLIASTNDASCDVE